MKNARLIQSFLLSLTTASAASAAFAAGPVPVPTTSTAPKAAPLKTIELDLDHAIPIPSTPAKFQLKATMFKTKDNREGWSLNIPGGHPIATPAYWNGMLFVGGGYGSHEFYALNAETGAVIWKYQTGDDGPTAAVVEDGLCAFNTESCTVFVLNARTGKLVWQEWLGDPLMSQPAIYRGKLYIAYPAGQSHGQNQSQSANWHGAGVAKKPEKIDPRYSHRLLCADLKTGKHLWTQPITADAISAPIINNGQVLLTCQDGTSFCINADTGIKVWEKANSGTSAPLATRQGVVFTERQDRNKSAFEGLQVYGRGGDLMRDMAPAPQAAPYLRKNSEMNGLAKGKMQQLDSSVGFATPPADAHLDKAAGLPISNVIGGWAFQGSRVATKGDTFFYNQGTQLKASRKSQNNWTANFRGKGITPDSQLFSPPAMGKENIYLASSNGHIVAVDQKSGALKFDYETKNPITFQPALANGNIYVGTSDGVVMCLKTGDKDATDWTAWGGNAQHNKD
ncbi:MAG TPA: PQQ-binding-like beta-propeller repeat protein [Drouetiella sp.]|jgi:Ca-activated chloride channel homolog